MPRSRNVFRVNLDTCRRARQDRLAEPSTLYRGIHRQTKNQCLTKLRNPLMLSPRGEQMAKTDSALLFPILPQHFTGIARMAAEAEHTDDGHLIEFKALEVRSILNRTTSKRGLRFTYSINPYRGCEFG